MPQTYGDRVASPGPDVNGFSYQKGNRFTETILASYSGAIRYFNDTEWPRVAYLTSTFNEITLTPDPGSGVRVNSFQLLDYGGYPAGAGAPFFGGHNVNWKVYKDAILPANILASGNISIPNDGSPVISTGLSGYYAGVVILQIEQAGQSATDDLALDNLNFDQLPEPAGTMLLAAALSGLTLKRPSGRRRRFH